MSWWIWMGALAGAGAPTVETLEQQVLDAEIELMTLFGAISECPDPEGERRPYQPPCPHPEWVGVAHPEGLWVLEMVDQPWAEALVEGSGLPVGHVAAGTEFATRGRTHGLQGYLSVDGTIVWAGRFDDGWAEMAIRTELPGQGGVRSAVRAPPSASGSTRRCVPRGPPRPPDRHDQRDPGLHGSSSPDGPRRPRTPDPADITANEATTTLTMAEDVFPVPHDSDRTDLLATRDQCDKVLSKNLQHYRLRHPDGAPSARKLLGACLAVELAAADLPPLPVVAWHAGTAEPAPGHLVLYVRSGGCDSASCLDRWADWMQEVVVPRWHRGVAVVGVVGSDSPLLTRDDVPLERWPFPLAVVEPAWMHHVSIVQTPTVAVVNGRVIWSGQAPTTSGMDRLLDVAGRPQ